VKVQWSREDDMQHDPLPAGTYVEMAGGGCGGLAVVFTGEGGVPVWAVATAWMERPSAD
jgi:hypothetical protein